VTVTSASRPRLSNNRSLWTTASPVTPWVRPSEWLSLPDVTGQQRFAGLHRIDVDGNFAAITAAGAYTVDWGDGTTTNHATGTTAQKQYDYATISSTGESTLGYRQVIIQVYPQSGQNLTSVNLSVRHSATANNYSSGWLDVVVNGNSIATLVFGGANVAARYLQQATVLQNALTSTASMFQNCHVLQSVPLFNTASVTTMTSMFHGCHSLQTVPLFNTALVTNMSNMFSYCHSLQTAPLFNTAAATNISGMFSNCYSLQSVPLFNTAAATNTSSMFANCYSLQTVPLFNTALVTNMSAMFQNCPSLQSIPLFNTAMVTFMSNMFQNCQSLQAIPLFNTASATSMDRMFSGCSGLVTVPQLNTSACVNAFQMFNQAFSLASLPALNLPAVSLAANISGFVSQCPSLASVACTGINQTVSFASCKLSAAQINAIFTNLSSSGSGKTITVAGNYGAATCTPSIATAKGWTVTT
jgi:surface protein